MKPVFNLPYGTSLVVSEDCASALNEVLANSIVVVTGRNSITSDIEYTETEEHGTPAISFVFDKDIVYIDRDAAPADGEATE